MARSEELVENDIIILIKSFYLECTICRKFLISEQIAQKTVELSKKYSYFSNTQKHIRSSNFQTISLIFWSDALFSVQIQN